MSPTGKWRTADNIRPPLDKRRFSCIIKQPTANSQQPTANSQQPTANSQQPTYDVSIDIVRFFACLLITNSHLNVLYGPYNILATGGSIGNSLFFFCSGFTLFLGKTERFDNWYKKRIARIYPSVFAWAILLAFSNTSFGNIKDILLHGGGWFVSCIMIHYIILYCIREFMIKKLKIVFGVIVIITFFLFFLEDRNVEKFNMYNGYYIHFYFSWCKWFLFTLLGAIIGIRKNKNRFLFREIIFLLISIALYYITMIIGTKKGLFRSLQIFSLIPLLTTTYYFYRFCNSKFIHKVYKNKYTGFAINFISGLTLEIYIVQGTILSMINKKLNGIFPLNLIVAFLIILIVAYTTTILGKFFSQTFKENPYNWRSILEIKKRMI
jgi:hypothetical protein